MEDGNDYGEVENPANHPIVIPVFFRFNGLLLHITDVSKKTWEEFGDLNGVSIDVIDPILAALGFDTNTLSHTYEHQLTHEEVDTGFSVVRRTFEESIPSIHRIIVEEDGGAFEAGRVDVPDAVEAGAVEAFEGGGGAEVDVDADMVEVVEGLEVGF